AGRADGCTSLAASAARPGRAAAARAGDAARVRRAAAAGATCQARQEKQTAEPDPGTRHEISMIHAERNAMTPCRHDQRAKSSDPEPLPVRPWRHGVMASWRLVQGPAIVRITEQCARAAAANRP